MSFFPLFRRKPVAPIEGLVEVRARLFDERHSAFAAVRDSRVLIYWPHGFGDFVHLGYLLPLLESSNRYWIARYGDDFSALYQHHPQFAMLPTGVQETANCFGTSARDFHLGIPYGQAKGKHAMLSVLPMLADHMRVEEIDTVLWTDYPEPNGRQTFPFHTKIRSLARCLVAPERLAQFELNQRLAQAAIFAEDAEASAFVEERLRVVFGDRELSHICLILSGGHTAPRKNWDDENVQAFANAYVADAPDQRCVILLSPLAPLHAHRHRGSITTWSELFPVQDAVASVLTHTIPYARLISALVSKSALVVGVPAGPTHLAFAMGNIPTVGLWRAHHPAAYEEPHRLARHIVSKNILDARHAQFRISRTLPDNFSIPIIPSETDTISSAQVYKVAQQLLSEARTIV